jgi:hypothetical protein
MTSPLTINEVFEQLAELDGQPLELEGILIADDSGGYEILHYPNSARIPCFIDGETEYRQSIWLAFGNGSLQPNKDALQRWSGKRVRVHGVMRSISTLPTIKGFGKGGFGPWGLWPAEVEAYILQRVSADERREHRSID